MEAKLDKSEKVGETTQLPTKDKIYMHGLTTISRKTSIKVVSAHRA